MRASSSAFAAAPMASRCAYGIEVSAASEVFSGRGNGNISNVEVVV